ncbi:MAG: hypothetical protein A3E37_03660 [Candidatus Andersenbacteria bacterium RIFCSPHIGHO2_12_FULL_46_9]|nr:MAG: hypothetical protein A3B76_02370 [Candidatus Andersenbacteria bacterium RIFCSPHIGHO2_02_FULL_46_16]OGY36414.1 MAG: hypothetical protein A3E37_03660 [Candidatus Andersenbacteria bacterium RIFCSPHIGHO2_12_FULL_46_9]OGY40018.1 MAG: hypothetical protein A3G57_00890 [Candidatus Andersenbacteria bacterium RIFCSPLOWO2_12_FULL_45_8]
MNHRTGRIPDVCEHLTFSLVIKNGYGRTKEKDSKIEAKHAEKPPWLKPDAFKFLPALSSAAAIAYSMC